MPRKGATQDKHNDIRAEPAYTLLEASRYLRLSPATLRSWVAGRPYPSLPIASMRERRLPISPLIMNCQMIAVTHDGRIRYKQNELNAVIKHRVGLLVLIGKAPFPDHARSFVATHSRIETFLDTHMAPFIAKVYRGPLSDGARLSLDGSNTGIRNRTSSSD